MPKTTPIIGASFFRRRATRTVSGIATAGMMVGISLAGATSASAATDANCNVGNTVDATAAGTAVDIQDLFDVSTPIVCLSGTFVLAAPLTYDHELTIHGLTDAVLDGDDTTGILRDDSGDNRLTVENLRLTRGNAAQGGAIDGNVVVARNAQFDSNVATDVGGAIAASVTEVYDSLFFGNVAGIGGAIASEDFVGMSETTLRDNSAELSGGAIMSYDVAVILVSTFEGNDAEFGGAISAYGMVTSLSSTFEDNVAEYGGAIFAPDFGEGGDEVAIDVQNSTFVGNFSTLDDPEGLGSRGSAVFAATGSVRQSTFLNNEDSGSVEPASPAVTVFRGSIEFRGNIFAGSNAPAQLGVEGDGTAVDLGANVFTTAEAAETDLSSVQPTTQFGVTTVALFAGAGLADNGGLTKTVALHAGSPALSAVPSGPLSMTSDQRGVARPAISDAGAYEFDDGDGASGSGDGIGDGAGLAATGAEPAGWLVGTAGLLLAAGVTVLAVVRRRARRLTP